MTPTDQQPSPEAMNSVRELDAGGFLKGCILQDPARLIDESFADLRDMLEALLLYGWTCTDEGKYWIWSAADGEQFICSHSKLPPWPSEARTAFNEQRKG
jgi:hypothetical protein